MKESKLQYLGRTLAERVLIATGEERKTLCSVLADVMWVMGQDVELPENDPVHWFDQKGRFCTRAQSREEIDDAMVLMAIADGISIDLICRENPRLVERVQEWGAYQEMKCCYMEALMRIKELEEKLKEVEK